MKMPAMKAAKKVVKVMASMKKTVATKPAPAAKKMPKQVFGKTKTTKSSGAGAPAGFQDSSNFGT